jgi:hypothetical protein
MINKSMNNDLKDLSFAEYRLAVQLAKLPEEKVQMILKKAAILKQVPNKN